MIGATLLLLGALLASIAIARRCSILRHFNDLGAIGRHSLRTLTRRGVSDWSKERATRILARRMMAKSLGAAALLALIALPLLIALALGPTAGVPTTAAFFDPWARLCLLAAGISLAVIRFRLRSA